MRKLAVAVALASTALASPAIARDNSWYVGVGGGVMLVEDGRLTDAPNEAVRLAGPPVIPEGAELDRIDVVIRLRRPR